ncbi:MAG: hypothetical protein CM1200mP37_1630 [Chloroflexota bacterium]|nr:MAG: hypothetical protein CM1200mP37_1630 [Chloroflexota bacterium]
MLPVPLISRSLRAISKPEPMVVVLTIVLILFDAILEIEVLSLVTK